MSTKYEDIGDDKYTAWWPLNVYAEHLKGDQSRAKRILNDVLQDVKQYATNGSTRIHFHRSYDTLTAKVRPKGFWENWEVYWQDEWSHTGKYYLETNLKDVSFVIDKLKRLGYNISDYQETDYQVQFVIDWTSP